MRLVAGRVEHAGRLEEVLADVVLVRLAAHQVDHVTRDDVKNVVVRVAAAEAGRGLDEAQALDRLQRATEVPRGMTSRSPAPRPSPLRCTSRSRTVISRVTHGSYIWKPGM